MLLWLSATSKETISYVLIGKGHAFYLKIRFYSQQLLLRDTHTLGNGNTRVNTDMTGQIFGKKTWDLLFTRVSRTQCIAIAPVPMLW